MAKTEKAPAFQFYPKDYLSDINVQLMTLEERGAYLQLMCHEWEEKGLPNDDDDLSILSGLGEKWFEKSGGKIKKCFTLKKDKLIHPRLEKERKKQKIRRDVMVKASKKGHEARWGKKNTGNKQNASGHAEGMPQSNPKDASSSSTSSSTSTIEKEDKTLSLSSGEGKKQEKDISNEIDIFFKAWNEVATQSNLISARELTPDRRKKINTRLRERPFEEWKEIFNITGKTTFLNGVNQDGWQASFDWIIKNTGNGLKVLEGKYKKLMDYFITKEIANQIIATKTGARNENGKGLRRPKEEAGSSGKHTLGEKAVSWDMS